MDKNVKLIVWFIMLLFFPMASYSQKDVTQFLDIPVDGFKSEMIEKLKSRGYTINQQSEDVLNGEFNGRNVNIVIATNNNKVWRIGIWDEYPTDETNIKIRFNSLIQQFVNNNRYSTQSDSIVSKYIIPEDEDISYEMTVNNKRYEAAFYQKSLKHDSLTHEYDLLLAKEEKTDQEYEKVNDLILEIFQVSLDALNKTVWFMIKEDYGEYSIVIFYDNVYNEANGSVL